MFIPRTLAGGDIRLGRGPLARAIIVTLLLAAALTAILTLSVVPGQVAPDVGQVAQTEIRASRPTRFVSQSQTDAARLQAASAIPPKYEQIAPPAALLAPNQRISPTLTEEARQAARDKVEPVQVQVRQNEVIVRAGDLITQLDLEKLDQLGLTRPRLEIATVIGDALVAILLSLLLVAFLWRFPPQIWHRNRSLLLFGLTLVVSAVAIRIAGNRSIWTFAIPTSAPVMLIGILLEGYAGAAMAAALAVVAGVVNPSGFEPAVYVLSGGMASLLAVVSAERLNAFLRAGLVLALSNIAMVAAFGLMDQTDVAGIAQLA